MSKEGKADRVREFMEKRASSTRFPWERQFDERRKPFEAFVVYRDMGKDRSHVRVARELGKSAQLIARWSAKWSWIGRVEAWVDEQDRKSRLAHSRSVIKMNERHAALAVALTGKVIDKLNNVTPVDIEKMSLVSLSKLLEVGVKVERQARGEAGEVVSDRIEMDKSLSHLTIEELEELERIHDTASARAEQDQD